MILVQYLAKWDPMGFIEMGAPEDEYSFEAADIKLKFRPRMTEQEIAELIYEVFDSQIGIDSESASRFKKECVAHTPAIQTILADETNLR